MSIEKCEYCKGTCGEMVDSGAPDPQGNFIEVWADCESCNGSGIRSDAVDCVVNVTRQNARHRIKSAVHYIINNYNEWEAMAQQDAQREQDSDAYFSTMEELLGDVFQGVIFDGERE